MSKIVAEEMEKVNGGIGLSEGLNALSQLTGDVPPHKFNNGDRVRIISHPQYGPGEICDMDYNKSWGWRYTVEFEFDTDWDPNGSVTGLKLTRLGIKKIQLTWDVCPSAEGYEVWYAPNKNSSYYHKADITDTCYIDTSGRIDGCYKVRAYVTFEWDEREYNEFSEVVSSEIKVRGGGCAIVDEFHYTKDDISMIDESMCFDTKLEGGLFDKYGSEDGSETDGSEDYDDYIDTGWGYTWDNY